MKKRNINYSTIVAAVLLLLSAVVLYVTNRYIPFMMDDLWYQTKLSSDEPIRNLTDVLQSQVWHYNNWGGRSVAHTMLQLILLCGEAVADVLNVAVMFLLAWCTCVLAKSKTVFGCFAALGLMMGCNANWKLSMFWESGAANYLYITVIIFLYLYCFFRVLPEEGDSKKTIPGSTAFMIPLGLAAGWSNENMGPTVCILGILVMLLRHKNKMKNGLWMYVGTFMSFIGSVIMVIAPGNAVRSAQIKENSYGTLWKLFLRCYAECKASLEYLFPILLVTGFLLFVLCGVLKKKPGQRNCLLLFGALMSFGAMIMSPHYPDRATFGTMMLLVVPCLSMGRMILEERKDLKCPLLLGTIFIWCRGMFFLGEFLSFCWGWIK